MAGVIRTPMGGSMRFSPASVMAASVAVVCCLAPWNVAMGYAGIGADRPGATQAEAAPANDPVADPAAVIRFGHARFTVLTPQLIRMEWSAEDKFEDHASFVFINRRLPVPEFSKRSRTTATRSRSRRRRSR